MKNIPDNDIVYFRRKKKNKDINILFHNDQAVMLKEFPNKFFIKHWDNIIKTDYIIVENQKYYLNDLLKKWGETKNEY